ncbi:MAG TPA: hypothetical protein VH834_20885 [Solirubrobacteraceae bacterium]
MNVVLTIVAVLVAVWAIRSLRRRLPAAWPRAPAAAAPGGGVVGDLEWVRRAVAAASSAGEMHWRLRPVLREVAAAGLARRRIDLDADPAAARALLAPETWELVRPDRRRPDDPFAPGLGRVELRTVLDDLERLLA